MGGESSSRLGHTQIVLWRSRGLPGALDALIVPEDTHLVLQTSTEDLDPDVTPLDLWASLERAARTEKRPLGSVMIADGKGRGVKYIASVIVYDFEAEPICRKEAVLAGLHEAFCELAKRNCQTIGIRPLGTMDGGISHQGYLAAVTEAVALQGPRCPRTLYLLLPDAVGAKELDG